MSKLKIKSKLKKPLSSQWEIIEDDTLMAQEGLKISLNEFRPKFANSNQNIQQNIKKQDFKSLPKEVLKNIDSNRKNYLYNTLNPNEEDPFNIINGIRYELGLGRTLPLRDENGNEDAWKKYLQLPNDVEYSNYKDPTKSKTDSFFRANPYLENAIFNRFKNIDVKDSVVNEGMLPINDWYTPLNNFTIGKDKDKDGEFIYYRDTYDFSPDVTREFRAGQPFNFYNKRYLSEYKSGGKIKTDPKGYWNKNNHGKPVRIPSNRITMKGVNQPLLGISDTGDIQMMSPGMEYSFDGNSVTEFPITMQQGGQVRQPIRGTREQYQAYQDSLDLYKQHLKIKPIYPELPQISKEEYDRLHLKEKGLTKYAFDEAQYREDKKSGKQIKSFEDYVYSSPDSSFYQHPRTIANDEYGVKYKGVRDVNKYSQDTEKFKIVLSDGNIKEPMSLYDGKPEWDDYNLFSPDYKTQRMYSKNYLNNKYELQNIWSQKIAPIRTEYFGKDSLIDMGGTNISSSSTGWYKYGEKPKFKETSNKNFKNYSIPYEARDVYAKPVQPIIYQPQDEDFQKVIQDGNNRAGMHFKLETRQKQNIENIQPRQLEQLQIQPINQELQKIPFSNYFTRPRQSQEAGQGKMDYFDKKTGKLLMTKKFGGL